MMNYKEIHFEDFIEKQLIDLHGFVKRSNTGDYDPILAIDRQLVHEFVRNTQPDSIKKLAEIHGDSAALKFWDRLDVEIEKRGVLDVLRKGIDDHGVHLDLAYFAPQTSHNAEATKLYNSNIFTVIRQVHYSLKNRNSLDMVLFLNGIPIITIELKNQLTGQSVVNSINQYRTDRDPKEKLLKFKRTLVHFGVDTEEAVMTTELKGLKTYFLPFNKGNDESKGNPVNPNGYKTAYIWEDVWSPDSLLELIDEFITLHIEEKEDDRGHKVKEERLIFPRYHQRDAVQRLVADAKENGAGKTYLVQHSAGSGKSNTIAWTAHRLSELHGKTDDLVFNGVIVLTDRRVLDKQLSETVEQFAQVRGVVAHVDSGAELKQALENDEKVIISTLQKFPVISKEIGELPGKKFAVIIDEAHSSQSGESSKHVRDVLSTNNLEDAAREESREPETLEDVLNKEMRSRKVKHPNISYFAFTATPKQKTLEIFGEPQSDGTFKPFSLYSMRQAIEERFILDVLQNYTTYRSYFELLRKFKDRDPEFEKKAAQRLLLGYVDKHQHAIDQKTKAVVEHFHAQVAHLIKGEAKAMLVTKSRLHAVKFKQAFDKYLAESGLSYKALVAFSGTVKDGHLEFTESGMNKFSDKNTAEEFKKRENRFMIVANKFQTGFDQPLLNVMYIDKLLSGVNAVQTLSRLNRIHRYKDEVFVLDFVNETDDIRESFQPYYRTTILSEATDPNILYDLVNEIYEFKAFTTFEVEQFVEQYYKDKSPERINSTLDGIVARIEENLPEEKAEFSGKISDYIRKYAFLSQIITFGDTKLESLYVFLRLLKKKIKLDREELPYEMLESIDFSSYKLVKKSYGDIKLDDGEQVLEPMGAYATQPKLKEFDQLSRILKDVNDKYGTDFSDDDKVIAQNLFKKLKENEKLEGSISNNTRETAQVKFEEVFQRELVKIYKDHFDFYRKITNNNEGRAHLKKRMFDTLYSKKR
ncbi:MAG: DEAD/DEAH box helicase family protein [Candidatus Saccharimonadales bacterium]